LNVRLRDYQRGAPPTGPSTGFGITARIAGAGVVAATLLGIGTVFYLKSQSAAVPTDPATLCPTKRPPADVTVVLLDVSDKFSEPQRIQVQNHLGRLRDSISRFGLVEVYTVDRLRRRVTEPVVHVCNPGTGSDLNRIYQNPGLARKKWDAFAVSLTADIDRQISAPALSTSPIFEAIQSTALRTFGNPRYDGLPKRLVIVSDLLQHVPGGLSMYDRVPPFESFKTTPYFSRVRSDLAGVSVLVFYLARPAVAQQDPRHIAFWDEYFQAQGATLAGVEKIFGDK
jgi:hypothetical protein